jgi:hypothetical protein
VKKDTAWVLEISWGLLKEHISSEGQAFAPTPSEVPVSFRFEK